MIVYANDKIGFSSDLPHIHNILRQSIFKHLGEEVSDNEVLSWKNSLKFMNDVISDKRIPLDTGVVLEYNIPVSQNRIDFILTGYDENGLRQAILIELKQWEHIHTTDMDGVVETYYHNNELRSVAHPSYQILTYASLLYDFKPFIQEGKLQQHPCTYLHNHTDDNSVTNAFYSKYTERAPVFCKGEENNLKDFICRHIRKGDRGKSIYVLEDGVVRPSKPLADSIAKIVKGHHEYKMIDAQKVVYEQALKALKVYDKTQRKQVLIIEGGPGTGKSVIAIQLLAEMCNQRRLAHYITKNAAPRNVFGTRLSENGVPRTSQALFKSSVSYHSACPEEFDMLIVDEAHRLGDKNPYNSKGGNQIKEIMSAAKVSIFFIDENQIVTLQDIGSKQAIRDFANSMSADIYEDVLVSQFRCGGSDEYLKWLDSVLQIRRTNVNVISRNNYPITVLDDPNEMHRIIRKLNQKNNKSRVVAGFCWPWNPDDSAFDISILDFGYKAKWNMHSDKTWAISSGSVEQIGCIHTCQGLEFDYCGVIIGPDMIYRDGKVLVDPSKRAKDDFSIRDYKRITETEDGKDRIRMIIKNTYRTLLSRGMKGCYVYCVDKQLQEYLQSKIR